MWALAIKAAKYGRPPSDFFEELDDEWACYQFDNAVLLLHMALDNAMRETDDADGGGRTPRYTLAQLLEPDFRLPRDGSTPGGADLLRHAEGGEWDEV